MKCPVPEVEADPWVLSALQAANIDTLDPSDVDLWYWGMVCACRAERGRVIKDRSLKRG